MASELSGQTGTETEPLLEWVARAVTGQSLDGWQNNDAQTKTVGVEDAKRAVYAVATWIDEQDGIEGALAGQHAYSDLAARLREEARRG